MFTFSQESLREKIRIKKHLKLINYFYIIFQTILFIELFSIKIN